MIIVQGKYLTVILSTLSTQTCTLMSPQGYLPALTCDATSNVATISKDAIVSSPWRLELLLIMATVSLHPAKEKK